MLLLKSKVMELEEMITELKLTIKSQQTEIHILEAESINKYNMDTDIRRK
jgi:hypothetical protein